MTTFIKAKLIQSDDKMNIGEYRVAANITEYHIISKLIFLIMIIPKFIMIRQLFHVKMYVKNQHVYIGCTDFLVMIIELIRCLHST